MNFSILILTIGIPGSGKTTWVQQYKKNHPYTYVVSTDKLRKELTGTTDCDPTQCQMIHDAARQRVKSILDNPQNYGGNCGMGPEIIVDSTNVDVDEWIAYKNLGASVILAKFFDVDPETAMQQQIKGRERIVPKEILDMKWSALQKNRKYMKFIFNMII